MLLSIYDLEAEGGSRRTVARYEILLVAGHSRIVCQSNATLLQSACGATLLAAKRLDIKQLYCETYDDYGNSMVAIGRGS
jgi:hypothetical protein